MSKIANLVVGCGVAGVAGTAGAVTYVYSTKQVDTIKSKYSASLISTVPNNDAIWTKRWEKLKADNSKVLSNNKKLKQAQERRSSSTFFWRD